MASENMASENESDALTSMEEVAHVADIVPKLEVENIPVEYQASENFLIPGAVIDYLVDGVQFQSTQSNELFNVPYEKVRLTTPRVCPDAEFRVGDKVEKYVLDPDRKEYGWASGTIMSVVGSTYAVNLVDRNSIAIVKNDKVRAVTQPVLLLETFLHSFQIAVPENLHKFANDLRVHQGFHKTIGKPYMSYDEYKNCLVINSSEENCQYLANMLLTTHFKNLTHRMLLAKDNEQQAEKYAKLQFANFIEQFEVDTNLIKYVIGQKGKNIEKAKNISGIIHVGLLRDTNIIQIGAETKEALQEAYMYLKLESATIEIPKRMMGRVVGKSGNKIQEIADDSQLRHIIVNKDSDTRSEFVVVELIGILQSVENAKILIQYHLNNFADIQQLPVRIYSSSGRGSRRVISGRKYMDSEKSTSSSTLEASQIKSQSASTYAFSNQGVFFYNENLYRGRGRRPSAGSRGRSSGTRRARGRCGYQATQFHADKPEIEVSTNETVIQRSYSTTLDGASNRLGSARGTNRVIPNIPEGNRNPENTSGSNSEAVVQKSWFGKKWQNRNNP